MVLAYDVEGVDLVNDLVVEGDDIVRLDVGRLVLLKQ